MKPAHFDVLFKFTVLAATLACALTGEMGFGIFFAVVLVMTLA